MIKKGKQNILFSEKFLVYLLIIFFIIFFTFLSINKHNTLKSSQNDLGTYSQLTWNTLHGNFFEASGAITILTYVDNGFTQEDFNYLGAHFSPILLFFVPFFALWADPKIFLILQVIAVGVAALPIYWLAREKIKIKWAGLILVLSFLFYPLVHNALLYDFHEVTFAVPIITFALWFLHKKNYKWLIVFLCLLLIVQEHTSLIVFMFGIYLIFFQKQKKLGLIISLVSLIYFILVIFVFMPAFSPTNAPIISKSTSGSFNRYNWLGSTPLEMLKTIVTKPFWVFYNLLTKGRLEYLTILIIPLLGLSLFSGLFLLALPILAISFLSRLAMTYNVYFYHNVILVGILYFSAIFTLAKFSKNKNFQKILLILILIFTISFSYFFSTTPFSYKYRFADYWPSANARLLKEVKQLIPKDAPLATQNNLGPHFATRQKLFHFPYNVSKVDYVVLDIYNPYVNSKFLSPADGFKNVSQISLENWLTNIYLMFEIEEFGVIYSNDGWLVFQRGASRELNDQVKEELIQAIINLKI